MVMIKFNCPACGKKIAVQDEHAGKKARCPGCKQVIAIPLETIPNESVHTTTTPLTQPPPINVSSESQPEQRLSMPGHLREMVEGLDPAKVNEIINEHGDTLLHMAAWEGDTAITSLLIEKGAYVDCKNSEGNTPLHNAVLQNQLDTIELLITKGANVNLRDHSGRAPLFLAVEVGNKNACDLLLAGEADVNTRNNVGQTIDQINKGLAQRLMSKREPDQ